jgi:translation initiation factor IF-3
VVFRGREITFPEHGRNMLARIRELVKESGKVEQDPRFEGRNCVMILAPVQSQKPPQSS